MRKHQHHSKRNFSRTTLPKMSLRPGSHRTLFAEAGLRTLAFFLQVLRTQEQGEQELSYSEHVCAWVVFVRQSHPTCTSDEGHHYQTQVEENNYVHVSGFETSTLHSTKTMALIPRFNYVTMSGLHLAKPQGTNTTPFPKKLPQCRQLRGPGQWSSCASPERALSALSVGPPPRPQTPLPQGLTAVPRRSCPFFQAAWGRGR